MKKEIIKGNARGKYIIRQSDIDYIITEKTDDGYVSVAIFNSKEDVRRYLITELNISDDEGE